MRPGVPTTSCAPAEGVQLRTVFHAAVDDGGPQPEFAAQELRLARDLGGQLPGRDEDQGLTALLRQIDPLQDRQEKAPVLPLPVCDCTIRFRPARI